MSEFNTPTNPPAFPTNQNGYLVGSGMHLRDYFATHAMQAIISDSRYMGLIGVNNYHYRRAEDAYKMADAMLKAREA
jgi:hypothetical protein